ncbi:lipopolysaccharide biosynthesis protein [Niallia sp. JL1B1071]|uniref:lipopolysaccharide biosynthesis protein n=1 Tax=Niallia tiangongensis TaxID=3237105 RepID=UPI0037DCECD1
MKNKFANLQGNTKKVIVNVINGIGIKGVSILIGFLTIPVYMNYFENNLILGVWFTLLSILSWILNFDLGIGNGLRNKLVYTISKNDELGTRKYISSAYIFLISISILILCVLLILVQYIPWMDVFDVSIETISENTLKTSICIVIIAIMMQFVLRLIGSILYALQESFIPNFLNLITNILILSTVIICNYIGFNNGIIFMSIVYLIAVNLPLVIASILIFSTRLKTSIPSIKYFDLKYALETLKVGSVFLGLQLEAMIINNTSIFLITWLLGSVYVVEYNIYFKVFSLVSTIFSLITVPIWSAITKANAENDYLWIKKTTRTLQVVAICFSISQLLFFLIMQNILDFWLNENSFPINGYIMVYFAIEQTLIIWSGINASICSGLNEMKWQFVFMTMGAFIMFPAAMMFTKFLPTYSGILLAHSIALLPYCIGQTIWLERYISKGVKYDQKTV